MADYQSTDDDPFLEHLNNQATATQPPAQAVPQAVSNPVADTSNGDPFLEHLNNVAATAKLIAPKPSNGILDKAYNLVTGNSVLYNGGNKLYNLVTGNDRTQYPDMPNITSAPLGFGDSMRRTGSLATTSGDESLVNSLKSQYPNATFTKDQYGNPIIQFPQEQLNGLGGGAAADGKYYVDKPGINGGIVEKSLPWVVGGIANTGIVAAKGLGLLGRMALQGGSNALTSLGLDVAGNGLGAKQDVSGWRAAGAGLLGAGAEGASTYIGNKIATILPKNAQVNQLYNDSGLTQQGINLMKDAGYSDPLIFSPAEIKDIMTQAAGVTGSTQKDAAGQAARGILAQDVPMTQGQVIGDTTKEAVQRVNGGKDAFNEFDQRQAQGLLDQGDKITPAAVNTDIAHDATGAIPNNPDSIGQAIGDTVSAIKDYAAAKKDFAYNQIAMNGAENVGVHPDAVGWLASDLNGSVADMLVSPETMPAAQAVLNKVAALPENMPMSIQDVLRLRNQISSSITPRANQPQDVALLRMRDSLDEWLHEATDFVRVSGDGTAGSSISANHPVLDAVDAANEEANKFYSKFAPKGNNPAKQFFNKTQQKELQGSQIVNQIFGSGDLNASNGSLQTISHLVNGVNDDALTNQLRQAAVNRIFQGVDPSKSNAATLIGKKLDNVLSENGNGRPIIDKLFPPVNGVVNPTVTALNRLKATVDSIVPRNSGAAKSVLATALKKYGIDATAALGAVVLGHHLGFESPEAIAGLAGAVGTGANVFQEVLGRHQVQSMLSGNIPRVNPTMMARSPAVQGLLTSGINSVVTPNTRGLLQ
jgi:hypothetical protein